MEVADALREASANPGPGLRDAMAAHREATTQLVRLVRPGGRPGGKPLSEPMLDRVRALLQEATVDAGARGAAPGGPRAWRGGDGDWHAPAAAAGRARVRTKPAADEDDEEAVAPRARGGRARGRGAAGGAPAQRRADAARSAPGGCARTPPTARTPRPRPRERLEDAKRALLRTESEAEAAQEAADEARDAAADAARKAEVLAAQLRDAGG